MHFRIKRGNLKEDMTGSLTCFKAGIYHPGIQLDLGKPLEFAEFPPFCSMPSEHEAARCNLPQYFVWRKSTVPMCTWNEWIYNKRFNVLLSTVYFQTVSCWSCAFCFSLCQCDVAITGGPEGRRKQSMIFYEPEDGNWIMQLQTCFELFCWYESG
jgi:hypothetical protein